MKTIKLRSRADADGILHLQVPVGVTDNDFEVIVVVQSVGSATDDKTPEDLGWPPGFFEQTFGCFQNEPLVRGDQGELQEREELL